MKGSLRMVWRRRVFAYSEVGGGKDCCRSHSDMSRDSALFVVRSQNPPHSSSRDCDLKFSVRSGGQPFKIRKRTGLRQISGWLAKLVQVAHPDL